MQYTFLGFSQEKLIELGLDDRDAALLRYFVDFKGTGEMYSEQVGGETYYWIKYESIRKELPIIGNRMQKDAIYRRFKHMADVGVLKHYHKKSGGSFSFYTIGKEYYQLISSSKLPTQPELLSRPSGFKTEGSGNKTVPCDPKTGGGAVSKPEGYGFKTGTKDQSTKDQSTKKIRERTNSPALAIYFHHFPQITKIAKRREKDIVEQVTNLDAWKYTCWWWEIHEEWRPEHTEKLLDYYQNKAVPKFAEMQMRTVAPSTTPSTPQMKQVVLPPDVNPTGSEWERVRTILEQRMNRPSFNTWIRPCVAEPISKNGRPVKVFVPDEVFVFWLGEHYYRVMQDTYETVCGRRPEIEFVVCANAHAAMEMT